MLLSYLLVNLCFSDLMPNTPFQGSNMVRLLYPGRWHAVLSGLRSFPPRTL